MNVSGIIVEYNPFHNGHKYHLEKVKELTDPDLIIAVVSGNFCQRGDLSIINKFEKTKLALQNGIDLVLELPYIFTLQNASVFGQKSVEILNRFDVNNLVFGSETGNLDELMNYARYSINIDHLKEIMDTGASYPKAYGLLAGSLYPNDILAISYLRALSSTSIKPFLVKRTSHYQSSELNKICSAKAIREAIRENRPYNIATDAKIIDPVFIDDLYPYIQRKILTSSKIELNNIFLINEGIENLFIKNAQEYDDCNDFINACVSKRYTKARVQRSMVNIALNITKKDVLDLPKMDYVRVLGFNSKGREYLRQYREADFKVVTQFKNIPEKYKEIEWKASNIYASMLNARKEYLKQELKGPIIV